MDVAAVLWIFPNPASKFARHYLRQTSDIAMFHSKPDSLIFYGKIIVR
jgi:hypothetical protein